MSPTYSPFLDLSKQILAAAPLTQAGAVARAGTGTIESSSGAPFWGDSPSAYETVRFTKNLVLPGSCRIEGKGFEQRVQRDKAPGTHGARVKQLGIQPAKVNITIRMWTADHLATFEELIPIFRLQRTTLQTTKKSNLLGTQAEDFGNASTAFEAKGLGLGGAGFLTLSNSIKNRSGTVTSKRQVPAGPAPVDIYHPMLALFRIRSVHVLSVSIPESSGDADVWESRIECEEFIWRPSAVKVADQSMDIVESNPRIGKTGFTLASQSKKPSDFTAP